MKISAKFFPVPFVENELTGFIRILSETPEFKVDTSIKRTDSTLLFFKAHSTSFNPFTINISSSEIIIHDAIIKNVATPNLSDTLLKVRIIGITDTLEESYAQIKNELKRIRKSLQNLFDNYHYKKQDKHSVRKFEMYSFYQHPFRFPQLTIYSGGHYKNVNVHCIVIELSYPLPL